MSDRLGTPEVVLFVLAVVLAAGALALGGGGGGSSASRTQRISPARIALVERRVEALRGLRFRHPVPVRTISAAAARAYGVADDRRTAQPARERAQVEVEKLLGLLAPEVDAAKVTSAIYGEQVAGFYDPHRKRLMLVRGAGVDDVTLAHELTHALEDQHFGIDSVGANGRPLERLSDDASAAYTALVEGTATDVMTQYMLRYPRDAPSLGDALGSLGDSLGGTPLPPYVMRGLLFPYLRGEGFVTSLQRRPNDWALVNVALRYRPPLTTAEVLDPARWLRAQQPAAVRLPRAPAGAGWRPAVRSTFGRFETTQLLYATSGSDAAQRIAAGWEGGRYALWRRGAWSAGSGACAAPCRMRDALVVAWRLRSPRAADALAGALRLWLRRGLHARPVGRGGGWRLPGGSSAGVGLRGGDVHVALAPSTGAAAALLG